MRFGLTAFCTPESIDPGSLATAAEQAGFDLLLFPDHTHVPDRTGSAWPGWGEMPDYYRHIYDPFVASAFALSATVSLRVGVGVCLIPARDPHPKAMRRRGRRPQFVRRDAASGKTPRHLA